ncbi:E3 ubiquitin-protein ligase FANCL isoform X4 [Peromyscus maniculatus bairdii]|uniref:E3 ubiquitin-protein ligase FANCL isoform X4 n=1 Tax=Peromyscus maniculatus bairdii TaxID=230844 RepID=UPI001C2DF704|nr:E3 ubiquitin-protein ligase FANCL isoform X4 [Peromyscus maniculatus bairdii]
MPSVLGPADPAGLFPPRPVPAPSRRRLRMCGGHSCAPWQRLKLTCCATSRCCFLRTGRKQCMRDSFRLRLVCVDTSFSTVKLKAHDASGRKHVITIKLKAKHPVEPPDCVVDFPVPFSVSWTPQSSLVDIHSQFLAALESLKTFWDVMDEIDEKTWVLEPEKPPRSATARRIVLGNNVSINIEVDPRHPTMLPEFCFLGADHVIKPLGIKLSGNIHLWDPENSLLQNLKDVLEIDFPARTVLEESDFSMDCGICYARHLNGAIPDQVCDNPQCGQPFHQICLYEWLRGLSTSRQSFNVLFGECPYCSKPITLKMLVRKP